MEWIGYALALAAFVWCYSLSGKVKRLEQIVRVNQLSETGKSSSLKKMLEQNIGKTIGLEFYESEVGEPFEGSTYEIRDVDERWVLLKQVKGKEKVQLLRLDAIKEVEILQ